MRDFSTHPLDRVVFALHWRTSEIVFHLFYGTGNYSNVSDSSLAICMKTYCKCPIFNSEISLMKVI